LIEGDAALEVVRRIEASPVTVFSYLIDSRKFAQWMGVGAELDARPGGRYRIDVDGEHIAAGEYREVDPPHRVVMTWGWENNKAVPPGSSTVEITLVADGTGTVMRLRQSGLPSEPERRSHRDGWIHYTERMAALFP
jgi:uncharacterized protein YndB with AHSA1/START domain